MQISKFYVEIHLLCPWNPLRLLALAFLLFRFVSNRLTIPFLLLHLSLLFHDSISSCPGGNQRPGWPFCAVDGSISFKLHLLETEIPGVGVCSHKQQHARNNWPALTSPCLWKNMISAPISLRISSSKWLKKQINMTTITRIEWIGNSTILSGKFNVLPVRMGI